MFSTIYRPLAVCLILAPFAVAGQNENKWWFFGEAGVDFNGAQPMAYFNSAMDQTEGSASISDDQGNLLFYTDGIEVWNHNDQPMPNGYGLMGHGSSTQSALIVPKPSNCGIYYVFTTNASCIGTPLHYSVVDMSLDGGNGDVTIKNEPLYPNVTERLTGTLHSNGTDYWVVAQECTSLSFIAYRVTAAGIDPLPVISTPLLPDSCSHSYIGCANFSPDGTMLCTVNDYCGDSAYVAHFDANSGVFTDPLTLSGGYGVEFSPSSRFLYIQTLGAPRVLSQYDLQAGSAAAIRASRVVLDSVYFDSTLWSYQTGGALLLAPNGKIYVNKLHRTYLSCIEDPDLPGIACNYVDTVVDLSPLECQDGLPNHLKSYWPCGNSEGLDEHGNTQWRPAIEVLPDAMILIFPHPLESAGSIRLLDLSGRTARMFDISKHDTLIRLSTHGLAEGLYVLQIAVGETITFATRVLR